jgi:hypothetical protein
MKKFSCRLPVCGERSACFARTLFMQYLAKRESLSIILTVDHADFATYRIEGKQQFRVLPRKRM